MASIDIDVSDYLDELSTKELLRELAARTAKGDLSASVDCYRDWERLADFIAEGQTEDALALLARLSPAPTPTPTVLFFAHLRGH
jgi:hypothetical protein